MQYPEKIYHEGRCGWVRIQNRDWHLWGTLRNLTAAMLGSPSVKGAIKCAGTEPSILDHVRFWSYFSKNRWRPWKGPRGLSSPRL